MKFGVILLCQLFAFLPLVAQETIAVQAKDGDGIYAILRKQGLNPVKHYEAFLKLNKDNIKNGSELYLGRTYYIPNAEDSFKRKALLVANEVETPIFDKELAHISAASERLSGAVIYLLLSDAATDQLRPEHKNFRSEVVRQLTENLMVHGAKVYFFEDDTMSGELADAQEVPTGTEKAIAGPRQLSAYVEEINTRYLRNRSKYQRVLVLDIDGTLTSLDHKEMTVYHHQKSKEGQAFARHLIEMLKGNGLVHKDLPKPGVLLNHRNLFLAKNVLPPISMLQINNQDNGKKVNKLDKDGFSSMIATAVLADFEDVNDGN